MDKKELLDIVNPKPKFQKPITEPVKASGDDFAKRAGKVIHSLIPKVDKRMVKLYVGDSSKVRDKMNLDNIKNSVNPSFRGKIEMVGEGCNCSCAICPKICKERKSRKL